MEKRKKKIQFLTHKEKSHGSKESNKNQGLRYHKMLKMDHSENYSGMTKTNAYKNQMYLQHIDQGLQAPKCKEQQVKVNPSYRIWKWSRNHKATSVHPNLTGSSHLREYALQIVLCRYCSVGTALQSTKDQWHLTNHMLRAIHANH